MARTWHLALLFAIVSATWLSAADIPVTSSSDSGAGTLRQGLANAAAGDRLVFDPLLGNTTLANGSPLVFGQPVTMLDTNSITVTDSHAFTLAQPLTVDWAGTLNLNGIASDASGSTGGLIKRGLGTLDLSGSSTYSGGTLLQGGTLRIQNDHALGTGVLTVNNQVGNTVLDLVDGISLSNDLLLRTGVIVNAATGTTSRLGGVINESGGPLGLNKTGTGTLILSGANTFTGGVYVSHDGTIRVEDNDHEHVHSKICGLRVRSGHRHPHSRRRSHRPMEG